MAITCQKPILICAKNIREFYNEWHLDVLNTLDCRITNDKTFPCLFSRAVFKNCIVKFIFVEENTIDEFSRLAQGLAEYVSISRDWDGNMNTAYPLIVAFSQDAVRANSLAAYHDFGWQIIQRLHEVDPVPWPENVSKDPGDPSWTMCFNGMPLFINMSHPQHLRRRSRNLGDHFLMVINPRERFDFVAGDNPVGRKVRLNIRKRITEYDGVGPSPLLSSYGTEGLEWTQYGIPDEDNEVLGQCPFRFTGT